MKNNAIIDTTDKVQRVLEIMNLTDSQVKKYLKDLKFTPNVFIVGIEYGRDKKRAVLWTEHNKVYNHGLENDHKRSSYHEYLLDTSMWMVRDYFESINKKLQSYDYIMEIFVGEKGTINEYWREKEENQIVKKKKESLFVGDYVPQRSTAAIFKRLKANPIAVEPLGLGGNFFKMKPAKILGKGIVGDDSVKYNFPKFQRGDYVDGLTWGDKGVISSLFNDNGVWEYGVRFLRMDDDNDSYENELKSAKPTEELKKLRLAMGLNIGHLEEDDYLIFDDPKKEPYLHEKTNIPNVYRIRKCFKTYIKLDKMGWAKRYDGKMMEILPMTVHRVELPEKSMKKIDSHHAETLLRASYYYEKLNSQLKQLTK